MFAKRAMGHWPEVCCVADGDTMATARSRSLRPQHHCVACRLWFATGDMAATVTLLVTVRAAGEVVEVGVAALVAPALVIARGTRAEREIPRPSGLA